MRLTVYSVLAEVLLSTKQLEGCALFMAAWDGLRTKDSQRILILGATNWPFDLDDAVIHRLPRWSFFSAISFSLINVPHPHFRKAFGMEYSSICLSMRGRYWVIIVWFSQKSFLAFRINHPKVATLLINSKASSFELEFSKIFEHHFKTLGGESSCNRCKPHPNQTPLVRLHSNKRFSRDSSHDSQRGQRREEAHFLEGRKKKSLLLLPKCSDKLSTENSLLAPLF